MLSAPDRSSSFRAKELHQLLDILGERRAAVVLITGPPGMGKTSFLRALRERARARGWVTAGVDGGPVAIDPRTREQRFRAAVMDAISDDAAPDQAERARRDAAITRPLHDTRRADPFLEVLARRSPVLLLLDDYRPSPSLAEWFELSFLPHVRELESPVVVVVTQTARAGRVAEIATDWLELGSLDPEAVRATLLAIGGIAPPLGDAELEYYAHEVRTPLALESLVEVLGLAVDAQVDW